MRYFLRTLRLSWTYRYRLFASIVFAFLAAICWSLNFTAVYPVLKIFGTDQNLQQWANEGILKAKNSVEAQTRETEKIRKDLDRVNEAPAADRDKLTTKFNGELTRVTARLESSQRELYHLSLVKGYLDAWCPEGRFNTLAMVIGLVVIAIAIRGVLEFVQESLVGSVVNHVLFDIRNLFFRRAMKMDIARFGEQGTHELMSRFTGDVEMMGVGLKTLYGRVVAEPLRALACIALASLICWQLTFMFLVLVPISLYILTRVGKMMKKATRRLLEGMSAMFQVLQESFQGIRIIKAFGQEPRRRRQFRAATREYYRRAMLVVNIDSFAGPLIETLGFAAIAGALLVGAYLVLDHQTHFLGLQMCSRPLEMETLLQLYALLAAIADPVRKLSSVVTKIQSGAAAADRVFGYMDREPKIFSTPASELLERHQGSIEFRNVCFSYDAGHPILTGLDLRVEHGQIVALVGKNGCGKTTMLNLLPRFYDPDHGQVLIDGVNVREANLRSLRKQIAVVTQETFLFADTIHNNIAFAKHRATREQVEAAARQANAHDFIVKLPHGYDTRLGEAGLKISVGQRQKICLARAMLTDPAIVLLDEFTSAADAESEMEIHRILRDFMKGRTCFVITHRLNTLEIADRILVIDGGRVAAQGSHSDLLKSSKLYEPLRRPLAGAQGRLRGGCARPRAAQGIAGRRRRPGAATGPVAARRPKAVVATGRAGQRSR